MRILVAITGASGALYAQRLLEQLGETTHELHVLITRYGHVVVDQELSEGLKVPPQAQVHNIKSMHAPFASGSNPLDSMVIIPCTMGTMGRIAHGVSDDLLLRSADVMLKERRQLILVPRETPFSLIHIKNMELLLQAGATIMPANPSFYADPKTILDVVDTVVARVLDHMKIPHKLAARWQAERE